MSSGAPEVLRATAEGVATLTLNRPEKRNAFSLDMSVAATTKLTAVLAGGSLVFQRLLHQLHQITILGRGVGRHLWDGRLLRARRFR